MPHTTLNSSDKRFLRAEVHRVEESGAPDPLKVTYTAGLTVPELTSKHTILTRSGSGFLTPGIEYARTGASLHR